MAEMSEQFQGRTIEVHRSEESESLYKQPCWTGFYSRPDGQMYNPGGVYESAEACLEVTRDRLTWELGQKEIADKFRELLNHFEREGFPKSAVLQGLTTTLHEAGWDEGIVDHLARASDVASTLERKP